MNSAQGASAPSSRRRKAVLLGTVGVLALSATVMLPAAAAAAAKSYPRYRPVNQQAERASKEPFGALPKGPLQIFVSIDEQKLHLYADGVQVADTAVATGVPQLPTPTGVFSVIQKDRFHHSNIYSNAPMPFMQRITWSGVALHEGENIGHPASHGCIRMPQDFAAKLWVVTGLGVRVIVAKPELKPVDFADSHLFVHKDPATAAAPAPIKTAATIDGGKATDAIAAPKADAPALAAKVPQPAAAAAEAADSGQAPDAVVAAPSAVGAPQSADPVATTGTAAPQTDAPTAAPANGPAPTPDTAAQAAPVAPASAPDTAQAVPAAPASPEPAQHVDNGNAPDGAAAPKAAAPAAAAIDPPPAASAPAALVKQNEPAKPAVDDLRGSQPDSVGFPAADEVVPIPPLKPARLLEAQAEAHGPISIFISRKTNKIYVRQHFMPMFDAPVTIANPDQPLGTQVFTAMGYLNDGSSFRWNVVSMPAELARPSRNAESEKRIVRYVHGRRVEEVEKVASPPPPPLPTPEQVLARVEIPQDVVERISELMVPGSSLVVSDHALGDETGDGTDFIVVTH